MDSKNKSSSPLVKASVLYLEPSYIHLPGWGRPALWIVALVKGLHRMGAPWWRVAFQVRKQVTLPGKAEF